MNLSKCIIGGKSNYTQTVCCMKGEAPDDKNSVLLGFKDNLPVLKRKLTVSNMKDSPIKRVVKVEIDPQTGDKFINLNGKKLRMIPESQVPTSVKESTQTVKVNSPTHVDKRRNITVLGKIPPVLTSQLLYSPKYATAAKPNESHIYKTLSKNTNVSNLSEKSLIKHTQLIKVKNPIIDIDVKPQLADKSVKLITQDKDNFSRTNNVNVLNKLSFNILPKPVLKVVSQKVERTKMQALDLTKTVADKCVQTDKGKSVDVDIQVCIPSDKKCVQVQTDISSMLNTNVYIENPFSEIFSNFDNPGDPIFDDESLLANLSNILSPLPPTNSTLSYTPSKNIINLDNIHQNNQETQNHKNSAIKFYNDLRSAFIADDKGNMPIHVGILKNNINLVKRFAFILSILKQSIDLPNNYNQTPLQLAIIHNVNEKILSFLLEAGANIDFCNSDGNNVIHLACEYERIESLRILAEHADSSPSLNQHNHEGLTPLMICAANNLLDCAEILLYFDIDIDKRDQISGRTALFHAAENQHLNMVRLLLTNGANTKVKNFFGTSPHDAMYEVEDMDETIRILILGKSLKRKLPEEKVIVKMKKKEDKKVELRTYARFEKIIDMKVFENLPNKQGQSNEYNVQELMSTQFHLN